MSRCWGIEFEGGISLVGGGLYFFGGVGHNLHGVARDSESFEQIVYNTRTWIVMGWNQRGEWEPQTGVYATPAEVAASYAAAEAKKRQAEIKIKQDKNMAIADAKIEARERQEREAKEAEEAKAEAEHKKGVQEWKDKTPYNKGNSKEQGQAGYYSRKERRQAGKDTGHNKPSWGDVERARDKLKSSGSSQLEYMRDLLLL